MYNVPTHIYIDLSKAFDTLDHSILLSKLKYYGVTGCSYDLLSSYLTDRSQYVEFSGHKSDTLPISIRGTTRLSTRSITVSYLHQ